MQDELQHICNAASIKDSVRDSERRVGKIVMGARVLHKALVMFPKSNI